MVKLILLLVIVYLVYSFIYVVFIEKHSNSFDLYIGLPGSGKTTFAAYLAKKSKKHKREVMSNVAIKDTYKLDVKNDLGIYNIENKLVIVDEAGIEFPNRKHRDFPDNCLKFFKYHRHYDVDVAVFSQDLDMDIKIRKLSRRIFLMEKSRIPGFVVRHRIDRTLGLNEQGEEIVDKYRYPWFGRKRIFCPPLWKLFNSVEHEELPDKIFEKW